MTTFRLSLCSVLLVGTLSLCAQPMSYDAMRDNARYLTDRMAYSLGLADPLLDDLYCINYDYICGVNDYLDDVAVGYRYDDYNLVLAARDAALMALLTPAQWTALIAIDYFYRPIVFASRRWYFGIYRHMPFTGHWYFRQPAHYPSYRGGLFFGGMNPGGGHAPGYQMRRQQPNNRGGNRGGNVGGGNRGGSNSSRNGGDNGNNHGGGARNNNGNVGGGNGPSSSQSDTGTSSRSRSTSIKSNARSVSSVNSTGSRTGKLDTNSGSLSKSSSRSGSVSRGSTSGSSRSSVGSSNSRSSSSRVSAGKSSSSSSSRSSGSGRTSGSRSSGGHSGGGSRGGR